MTKQTVQIPLDELEADAKARKEVIGLLEGELASSRTAYEQAVETIAGLQDELDGHRLPEAPASLNFYAVTQRGWNLQFTLRSWSEQKLLDRFAELVKRLEAMHVQPKPVGQQPAVEKASAPTPPQLATVPGLPGPQPAPAPANGGAVQTLQAVKLEITPKADGKAELKFYGAGHQYPDITSTRSLDKLLELLAPTGGWTGEHLAQAGSYNVQIAVDWKASDKLNSKGKPYKDVLALRPAKG